MKNSLLHNIL